MDWPVVCLLLGPLVPITVALIKFVPTRTVAFERSDHNGVRTDIAVLQAKYEAFSREVDLLRREMGSLSLKLESVQTNIVEMLHKD